uniref:DUF2796 domain-containing protein n=1 Tax=Steinernema glaseri TaxID=37863 RepID=A0A1I7ZXI8_9BILA
MSQLLLPIFIFLCLTLPNAISHAAMEEIGVLGIPAHSLGSVSFVEKETTCRSVAISLTGRTDSKYDKDLNEKKTDILKMYCSKQRRSFSDVMASKPLMVFYNDSHQHEVLKNTEPFSNTLLFALDMTSQLEEIDARQEACAQNVVSSEEIGLVGPAVFKDFETGLRMVIRYPGAMSFSKEADGDWIESTVELYKCTNPVGWAF